MKVFITGASSGIGQALAFEYAQRYQNEKTFIGLVARRSEHLQKLQQTLQLLANVQCVIYALDVRDHSALANAARDFIHQFGAPDVVIASAGVSSGTLTEQQADVAAFQAVMDINVMGLVHTFQPFISSMRGAGKGQLVGIASVAGVRGLPGAGAYSASKAAAIAYLESLRVEMLHHNIAVTTIAPGYIRTPMTDINTYSMPFLMDADIAAKKFVSAIEQKRRFVVIPWQMGWVARLMRLIPPVLWDLLAKNAPHKPRVEVE
ncbi:MAG: short-chain dehydrogenase [Methylotenera sp. 24-45-7]|jgi:short-subunit dehydrogenase|nr:MAG: short-chain dehydrogenase [Mehylophilales bacterium 35-46-6]OYZ39566.1 MAG: short-chain dehydrogenase [Methylotenera sp. 24-45-7]OZA07572.1 MAG: short-chain dehydrogenase [Methylotenera sp. 17-45-7]OZA53562.1 MAG: short-chain dehydrogenase [Methylophilales bacterium 39-45-7]HQS37669.1 SDR family oxidoreductase [Methylotenera sp.]